MARKKPLYVTLAVLGILTVGFGGCPKKQPEVENETANTKSAEEIKYVDHLTKDGFGIAINPMASSWEVKQLETVPEYDTEKDVDTQGVDFRHKDLTKLDLSKQGELLSHVHFDSMTVWPAADKLPKGYDPVAIMENSKNPGLGAKGLHKEGIDGRGVGVAIIDQKLLTTHQEYKDNLKFYEEIYVVDNHENHADMHGTAVASIAVGKTCGVAPGADLYHIASHAPIAGREKICSVFARAINRILEINKKLQENKIRVISISLGFNDDLKDANLLKEKIEQAEKEGVFVITSDVWPFKRFNKDALCRSTTGDADDPSIYSFGSVWDLQSYNSNPSYFKSPTLMIPMSNRTSASDSGDANYQYNTDAGWSWTCPYVAGCYALACQVNPDITPELFWETALKTGDIMNNTADNTRKDKNNAIIINLPKLIKALQSLG
ncbi:hypothetical protein FACS1894198_3930 [Clostridia bacterium]|nr:hypothetical protein FACS1894198_3930 [Clostridia bacterium]